LTWRVGRGSAAECQQSVDCSQRRQMSLSSAATSPHLHACAYTTHSACLLRFFSALFKAVIKNLFWGCFLPFLPSLSFLFSPFFFPFPALTPTSNPATGFGGALLASQRDRTTAKAFLVHLEGPGNVSGGCKRCPVYVKPNITVKAHVHGCF